MLLSELATTAKSEVIRVSPYKKTESVSSVSETFTIFLIS